MPIAPHLKHIGDKTSVAQKKLACRSDLNCNHVSMIERCENASTVDVRQKLATAPVVCPVGLFQDKSKHSDDQTE